MTEKLEFDFQILQTDFRVVYSDVIDLDADIVVSTDDTFFSASSGVSSKIREKIGKSIFRQEVRKHTLPVPVGSIIVTSAGHLKAKYICHVAALDLIHRPNPYAIIPMVVHRVVDIANAFQVESLVSPILLTQPISASETPTMVSQLTGQPAAEILDLVLRSFALYIAKKRTPISLRTVTIAIYQDDADDHSSAEKQLLKELATIHQQITDWTAKLKSVNTWMVHANPLLALLTGDSDDEELRQLLDARLLGVQDVLDKLFGYSKQHQDYLTSSLKSDNYESVLLTKEEYLHQEQRLSSILNELTEEIDPLEKLIKTTSRNLNMLEIDQAEYGGDMNTPLHLRNQIQEAEEEIEKRNAQLKPLKAQQGELQRRLEILENRWRVQQELSSTSPESPLNE